MDQINPTTPINPMPRHIAIIMDGNGRWAKKRGLPRKAGHKAGADALEKLAKGANELGTSYGIRFFHGKLEKKR